MMTVGQAQDPRVTAPVDSYLTDGWRLILVLQSDHTGAWVEDCKTFGTFRLRLDKLAENWKLVQPMLDRARAEYEAGVAARRSHE